MSDEKIVQMFNLGCWVNTEDVCRIFEISFSDALEKYEYYVETTGNPLTLNYDIRRYFRIREEK